jgi:hypothetical protein
MHAYIANPIHRRGVFKARCKVSTDTSHVCTMCQHQALWWQQRLCLQIKLAPTVPQSKRKQFKVRPQCVDRGCTASRCKIILMHDSSGKTIPLPSPSRHPIGSDIIVRVNVVQVCVRALLALAFQILHGPSSRGAATGMSSRHSQNHYLAIPQTSAPSCKSMPHPIA